MNYRILKELKTFTIREPEKPSQKLVHSFTQSENINLFEIQKLFLKTSARNTKIEAYNKK